MKIKQKEKEKEKEKGKRVSAKKNKVNHENLNAYSGTICHEQQQHCANFPRRRYYVYFFK